jgi:DNA-binding MarR family transcriptional regulator
VEADSETRWLADDERETWMSLAGVLMRLPGALDAQLERDAGLTHFEYLVLSGLSMSEAHTMRMSDLAAVAEGSLPRLSQVVSRLEKRGWVRRRPDETDGRYTLATLTEDGWAKVVATAPGHVEAVRRFVFDPLTKAQQRHLREIGRRIMGAVAPNDRCPRVSEGS